MRYSIIFPRSRKWCSVSLIAGLLALPAYGVGAEDGIVVVMSSDLGPYQEALKGFQEAYGQAVPAFSLSAGAPKLPSGVRLIVAIGGKAALYPYPDGLPMIYCLAPGTKLTSAEHSGQLLRIYTSPSALVSIAQFKAIQPDLKRLAILWAGDSVQDYIDQKVVVAERLGVQIISERIRSADQLPDRLRAIKGKVDAIWLPPDATMVTPKNFATIKEFSSANGIPFYVPSEGLVEQGALGSVTTSFKEIGALAGVLARAALKDGYKIGSVFPERGHLTINLSAAKACKLKVSSEVLAQAEKVIP